MNKKAKWSYVHRMSLKKTRHFKERVAFDPLCPITPIVNC